MMAARTSEGDVAGIVTGPSYSVISFYKLANDVKLIKLRNPWGTSEWSGAWSDDSNLWTS